ncbi:Otoferlin Fer-1-like protein 2 [Channa argus]|uniref:Otoferlin Fer-1-like protein 2 n=1 Tax=Channa argus TaxID=215402 RepID=A0A6G1QF46_CHAAH|nr:Otoferlin Fer-1-like protein 2 [Channa argus]
MKLSCHLSLPVVYIDFFLNSYVLENDGPLYFRILSRPDIALLWFLIPFKAAKHLVCDQYRWLTIKIVTALLLLAILALFLYNMPGYMVKKMLGA